ncbi:MAG: glycosyltransferase [Gemmatimonas sp.]|nr:glycosyltransferase [Gemmatimonas sp.]
MHHPWFRTRPAQPVGSIAGVRVGGKFLFVGEEKFYVRGTTYGPFQRGADGDFYHDPEVVARDFEQMAECGINAVRTYTVPPRWLLDCAERFGLRVLIGSAWEQHVAFLEDRRQARDIERRVQAGVRACAGHPAVLGYAVGNEIPASVVRWYGRRRVEGFLKRLYGAAKSADPSGLVTYVNYPTTEYLELPFLDFVSFNVYLESQERLERYLARLQNLSGDRPVVMGELGLDSRTHGMLGQARMLDWQLRTVYQSGCAGAFVFAWTDEWHRGGHEVAEWDFGVTDRERRPKAALASMQRAFAEVPVGAEGDPPRVTIVVCSYNGERTLGECLAGVERIDYPNYEVLVVNDGSTDATSTIARSFDVRLIRTANQGLSNARNVGLEAATGEIVAYLDDDAYPDPHWLQYLVGEFSRTSHVGIGGPNVAPLEDGLVADCVAIAPGGPSHVLVSDREAEHLPGCNMAFRKAELEEVGGFDRQFRVAGDDVDICWRLQERGWTLGFSPAAMVWHHRRNTVRGYWRQQQGYGRAEAMLERKWPSKYNSLGHVAWAGRLYGAGAGGRPLLFRGRVYQGTWGSALFQSIYQPRPRLLAMLPLMPEWYLVIVGIAMLAALGANWSPLLAIASLATPAAAVLLVQAGLGAGRGVSASASRHAHGLVRVWALSTFLFLLQPLARLIGRLGSGLTPWRRRSVRGRRYTWPSPVTVWSERWRSADEWLRTFETHLRERGVATHRGGDFDNWDFEVRTGSLGAVRLRFGIEEHGGGRQLIRLRWWPRSSLARMALLVGLAGISIAALADGAWLAGSVLGGITLLVLLLKLQEFGVSASAVAEAARSIEEEGPDGPPTETPAPALRLSDVQAGRLAASHVGEVPMDSTPVGPPSRREAW